MDTDKVIIEQAKALMEYLCESVRAVFVSDEILDEIGIVDDDEFREKLFPYMSSVEREWFDLVEGFIDDTADFLIGQGE